MAGPQSLSGRQVLPFYASLLALVALALLIDSVLHLADAVWIGRYLGIPGTLLILASSRYSLRKRNIVSSGKPGMLFIEHDGWPAWVNCCCWSMRASNSTLGLVGLPLPQ